MCVCVCVCVRVRARARARVRVCVIRLYNACSFEYMLSISIPSNFGIHIECEQWLIKKIVLHFTSNTWVPILWSLRVINNNCVL